jgi:hypothetical protein
MGKWLWPVVIVALLFLFTFAWVVPMAQKERKRREIGLEQRLVVERDAPLLRTAQMWRDLAERATLKGDADYYNALADEAQSLLSK